MKRMRNGEGAAVCGEIERYQESQGAEATGHKRDRC